MSSAQINREFLSEIDAKTKADVLENIAKHYGITSAEAYEEVTAEEAEHLLDFVTGPVRTAVSVLMQSHRLAD